jgi:hypothetical protein
MLTKYLFNLFSVLILSALASGCATIVHGTTQDIPISTKPEGCIAKTADGQECKTPCKMSLKRKEDHIINISKEGHETSTVKIQHVVSGAVAGNILAGGLIGWGIDAATGGQYRLVPELVDVELKCIEKKPVLLIDRLKELKELEELKAKGTISENEYNMLKEQCLKEIKNKDLEQIKIAEPVLNEVKPSMTIDEKDKINDK